MQSVSSLSIQAQLNGTGTPYRSHCGFRQKVRLFFCCRFGSHAKCWVFRRTAPLIGADRPTRRRDKE